MKDATLEWIFCVQILRTGLFGEVVLKLRQSVIDDNFCNHVNNKFFPPSFLEENNIRTLEV